MHLFTRINIQLSVFTGINIQLTVIDIVSFVIIKKRKSDPGISNSEDPHIASDGFNADGILPFGSARDDVNSPACLTSNVLPSKDRNNKCFVRH
jgi:hypothetical protein